MIRVVIFSPALFFCSAAAATGMAAAAAGVIGVEATAADAYGLAAARGAGAWVLAGAAVEVIDALAGREATGALTGPAEGAAKGAAALAGATGEAA